MNASQPYKISVPLGELAYSGRAQANTVLRYDTSTQQWVLALQTHPAPRLSKPVWATLLASMLLLSIVAGVLIFKPPSSPTTPRQTNIALPDSPPRLDPLLRIQDTSSILVRQPEGGSVWVRVGEQLPSGAILLQINPRTQTAQTDYGLLTMEP